MKKAKMPASLKKHEKSDPKTKKGMMKHEKSESKSMKKMEKKYMKKS
jgi:hypothetical protein